MHVPSCLDRSEDAEEGMAAQELRAARARAVSAEESIRRGDFIGTEEIDAIIRRSVSANQKENAGAKWGASGRRARNMPPEPAVREYRRNEAKEEYVLVDGYNVIFAWEELKELAAVNLDGARGSLQDTLCDYQALKGCELIVVFDAYRVMGHVTEIFDYHNIHVVFTREAETADQYIEKFAHQNAKKYQVTVVTSDGLEQIIIRGEGCRLISSRELKEEVMRLRQEAIEAYHS